MDLIAGLWSELPSDVQEQVLSRLTVPDLCRYRSVCRRWNSLICAPEFGALCIQNATSGANRGECLLVKLALCIDHAFIAPRRLQAMRWTMLDINTRRWYDVTGAIPKGYNHQVMATDGGLVCTFENALTEEQHQASTVYSGSQRKILIVSDLIKKTINVLPNPPCPCIPLDYAYLRLVVDNISQTYKLFLKHECRETWISRNERLGIYESSTNQWRMSPTAPCIPLHSGRAGRHVCMAVFHGVLYVLFAARSVHQLYSYSNSGDYWEDTGVQFALDYNLVRMCDLVVSDNRLFLISRCMMDRRGSDDIGSVHHRRVRHTELDAWPLDITEIFLAEKHSKTVVQMTPAEVFRNFDIQGSYNCTTINTTYYIRAHGFDKSILLMSEKVRGGTGKYMLYNLVTGLWEVLPPNPVESDNLYPPTPVGRFVETWQADELSLSAQRHTMGLKMIGNDYSPSY